MHAPRLHGSWIPSARRDSPGSVAGPATVVPPLGGTGRTRPAPPQATHATDRGGGAGSRSPRSPADSVHGRLPPAGATRSPIRTRQHPGRLATSPVSPSVMLSGIWRRRSDMDESLSDMIREKEELDRQIEVLDAMDRICREDAGRHHDRRCRAPDGSIVHRPARRGDRLHGGADRAGRQRHHVRRRERRERRERHGRRRIAARAATRRSWGPPRPQRAHSWAGWSPRKSSAAGGS